MDGREADSAGINIQSWNYADEIDRHFSTHGEHMKILLVLATGTMLIGLASCNNSGKSASPQFGGTYSNAEMSMRFENGICYGYDKSEKDHYETKYIVKNDKVYIAPYVPKGVTMIRNAWPVYIIKGNSLESSHVEDMDTGDVFYKDKKPKIILTKE